jgi:hypothetical protein
MGKRQVDALTLKSGPAEDGLMGTAPPSPTPVPATDYTTWIVVGIVVIAVVLVSVVVYLVKRKKTPAK